MIFLSYPLSEALDVEFIIPVGLIESGIHIEGLVIHTLVFPLTKLVEDKDLLGDMAGIYHVEVEALVLLHPAQPGGGPVIVLGNGDHLVDWEVH